MNDRDAGRAASDRLAHSLPDRSWVADAPSVEWARGAIEPFGELLRDQPAKFKVVARVPSEAPRALARGRTKEFTGDPPCRTPEPRASHPRMSSMYA
jgi:hypothetical protein